MKGTTTWPSNRYSKSPEGSSAGSQTQQQPAPQTSGRSSKGVNEGLVREIDVQIPYVRFRVGLP